MAQATTDALSATKPTGAAAETAPVRGVAARQHASSTSHTVLNTGYELREIVVAQGVEHHNIDPWLEPDSGMEPHGFRIPRGLVRYLPDSADHEWKSVDDTSAIFLSHTQRVRYTIRVITTKDAYKDALETPDLHVIYMGHSRYGRGQCYGKDPSPGDHWEQGTGASSGLLRMGYPVVGVHYTDLEECGYHFYPVGGSTKLHSDWLHPDISRSGLHRAKLSPELQQMLLPQAQPAEETYWASHDSEGKTLLLWAGWNETISAPFDLGATELKCRCLCLFSCSTRRHFWHIVRERKHWRRTKAERFAYFTTSVSYPLTAWAWLRAVFEYSKRNDYQSWYPSLEWAKRRCSRILAAKGYSYGIY